VTIEFANESEADVDADDLVRLARHVMDHLFLAPDAELSVICVDADRMADLHVQWMDEPGPTDVLSFPMDELRPGTEDGQPVQGMLGDIVLCPSVAAQQAAAAGHSTEHELRILLAHGVLHLVGYDHAEPAEEARMFTLQRSLVEQFESGIAPR
jgi:probable rRNA maturation factor